jgi:hypothetical protein
MRLTILLSSVLLAAASMAEAQHVVVPEVLPAEKHIPTTAAKWEHSIQAGLNFGASAPLSIPDNIRKINVWAPTFAPMIGYEVLHNIDRKWAVGAAVKVDMKGMYIKDQVMYLPTIITTDGGGKFEGTFSGTNETHVRNSYISLPVHVVFSPDKNWKVKLGLYGAWLFSSNFKGTVSDGYIRNGGPLGEKVEIDEASFDFGHEMNEFDWGVQAAGERMVGKKIAVLANFNWGMRPLFPSSFEGMNFKLYNMYLTLGVRYYLPSF